MGNGIGESLQVLVGRQELIPGRGQFVHHGVEGLGKLPHEVDPLAKIAPADHLGLPGEMAQPGLQGLEGAGHQTLGLERRRQVSLGNGQGKALGRSHLSKQPGQPGLLVFGSRQFGGWR